VTRRPTASETDLQSLLERARQLPRQPDAVRARVLGRARMAASAPLPTVSVAAPRARAPRQLLAPAAAAAVASAIVGSVFAFGGHWFRGESSRAAPPTVSPSRPAALPPAAPAAPPAVVPSAPAPAPAPPETTRAPEGTAPLRVQRGAVSSARPDPSHPSYGAELELMRSAHVAYARHDFTSALLLAGEHARRFPGGLLTEEREALRVRSLLGAGRLAEARRAVATFATRFPRSVLVHRLQTEVGANGD